MRYLIVVGDVQAAAILKFIHVFFLFDCNKLARFTTFKITFAT